MIGKYDTPSNLIPYAGIGSRETPEAMLNLISNIAWVLVQHGFILRSGGTQGADSAFERGVDYYANANHMNPDKLKEIYLPWKGFNKSLSELILDSSTNSHAVKVAELFHPRFSHLSDGAIKLQARNSHQVLGPQIYQSALSRFVICYTKNGDGSGGTGQAIRIAKYYDIPIIDLGKPEYVNISLSQVINMINEIMQQPVSLRYMDS